MKLWNYDPATLLPNLPKMITFPTSINFMKLGITARGPGASGVIPLLSKAPF
jgi:hypothetical protein